MPSLLDIKPEARYLIYRHLFTLPNNEILGLSREPTRDFAGGPPNGWIEDSRDVGLVYGTDAARAIATNSQFLETCRIINNEATPVFYGANKIILYAEDNNDIFYWLLDIGECNRRAIRHLEISWAYGVGIESARGNIHGILQKITDMQDSQHEEIQNQREQLIKVVQRLEKKTVRLIIRTLYLLVVNQNLLSLAVYLPGINAGDIWDLPNDNLYFADEIFSNSTANVHACIPEAIAKIVGIQTLQIGYTKDIELAEKIARSTGARELSVRVCPEGAELPLNAEERNEWGRRGWRLEAAVAYKTLIPYEMDQTQASDQEDRKKRTREARRGLERRPSRGGRLKASMFVDDEL
ncbi:hypothetical protein MMC17_000404 [Xylographa soralifera]|nr:hypothetical protein [Xylographa soralifera]